jgi:hypothetical protein
MQDLATFAQCGYINEVCLFVTYALYICYLACSGYVEEKKYKKDYKNRNEVTNVNQLFRQNAVKEVCKKLECRVE